MAEQSGNRAANYPSTKPWESTEIEQNSITYQKGVGSGAAGGDPTSGEIGTPAKENQFTNEAGEHFAKQGSLQARKKLSAEDGVLTTVTGN